MTSRVKLESSFYWPLALFALLWPAIAIPLGEAQAEWLGRHRKGAERLEQA